MPLECGMNARVRSKRNGLRRRRAPLAGEESRDRMLARFLGLEIPHLNHTIAATAQEATVVLQHFHCLHINGPSPLLLLFIIY
jgi:hypothetical protein